MHKALGERRKALADLRAKLEYANTREKELRQELSGREQDVERLLETVRLRDLDILKFELRLAGDTNEDIEMNRLDEFEELSEHCEALKDALLTSVRFSLQFPIYSS